MDYGNARTCEQVVRQYEANGVNFDEAMRLIEARWRATSGRFYGYAVAHEICAGLTRREAA